MKDRIVLLAATAIAALFVTQARAEYRAVGSDGIAASPKVRQMLNQQAPPASQPRAATIDSCCGNAVAKTATTSQNSCGQCCQHMAKQPQANQAKE